MKITKNMLVSEALEMGDTQALAGVLFGFGMHCLGCAMAKQETIEQAATVHGIDVDEMVAALNAAL